MSKDLSASRANRKSKRTSPGKFAAEEVEKPSRDGLQAQQLVLDVFREAFQEILSSESFSKTLQEVKDALFRRDFEKAFGSETYLEVYAARWSPTRALCYAAILDGLEKQLVELRQSEDAAPSMPRLRVLGIGGGAAETAALAAYLRSQGGIEGEVTLVDSAPWNQVVRRLHGGLTTPPKLSSYASEAAKVANSALIDGVRFRVQAMQQDILKLEKNDLTSIVGNTPLLVTLFFTLNELFTAGGIGKTTTFLLRLTDVVPSGSLLLVVDSPGSYSETVVGNQSKRYPMQWLLDKVLSSTEDVQWERIQSDDSVWFRLSDKLRYPIQLENMRYQIHLYRATRRSST